MKQSILQRLEIYIWKSSTPTWWEQWLRLLLGVYRLVNQSQIKLYSTSLTYACLLAAVPLLAVLFTLLKSFGVDKFLPDLIDQILEPMGPSGEEVGRLLLTFTENAQSGLLGGIGLVFLFYSVFSLFRKIEVSLNNIWSIDTLRPIKEQVFSYLGALMLVVFVAALALGLNIFFHQHKLAGDDVSYGNWENVVLYGAKTVSIIITAVMLAIIYSTTINTRVRLRAAFSGGLFCALLWLPLTAIFANIMAASSNYSLVYSSFAGLIILLVWLQILWLLFLSGSLFAYFVQFPNLLRPYAALSLNPAELEYYALKILKKIIRAFKDGNGAVNLSMLISETQLTHQQVNEILQPFLRKDYLVILGDAGNDFMLAKEPIMMTDSLILATVRGDVRHPNVATQREEQNKQS